MLFRSSVPQVGLRDSTSTPSKKSVPVRDSAPQRWGRRHRGALGSDDAPTSGVSLATQIVVGSCGAAGNPSPYTGGELSRPGFLADLLPTQTAEVWAEPPGRGGTHRTHGGPGTCSCTQAHRCRHTRTVCVPGPQHSRHTQTCTCTCPHRASMLTRTRAHWYPGVAQRTHTQHMQTATSFYSRSPAITHKQNSHSPSRPPMPRSVPDGTGGP